ncbi:ATP-binding protein [Streptomyces olivoreticuli]|uniref:ATP-binding protein n=1 Tax=Streptomyces olivoreticuli TaxID=68246 RepID=UPI00265A417F|nr:ATP-binding protein [Streptomyces olivoreticuli]WKK21028.1 ATP-binding protein [Streptomyces olivoreticuli]
MRTAMLMLSSPHSTTVDEDDGELTGTYHLTAPAAPSTARVAREFVAAALEASGRPGLVENALVCVSDLVTNVVQHARVRTLSVEVAVRGGHVVVSVLDGDHARRPRRRAARVGQEDGRGLALVRSLSVASGVTLVWDELNVVGKCVWFEPLADTGPKP